MKCTKACISKRVFEMCAKVSEICKIVINESVLMLYVTVSVKMVWPYRAWHQTWSAGFLHLQCRSALLLSLRQVLPHACDTRYKHWLTLSYVFQFLLVHVFIRSVCMLKFSTLVFGLWCRAVWYKIWYKVSTVLEDPTASR